MGFLGGKVATVNFEPWPMHMYLISGQSSLLCIFKTNGYCFTVRLSRNMGKWKGGRLVILQYFIHIRMTGG